MRRFLSIAFALLIMAALTGCQKTDEDVLHLGLNAIILEIDHENRIQAKMQYILIGFLAASERCHDE